MVIMNYKLYEQRFRKDFASRASSTDSTAERTQGGVTGKGQTILKILIPTLKYKQIYVSNIVLETQYIICVTLRPNYTN